MSYEVTATRRRPQRFEDLVGQEFVTATLKNAIQTGRIAHAYLFSGPRGCGKTSSARILAKSLNCEKGPTVLPCGECTACREIAKGSSLDVIEIDGASNTSVNDIRQIKDEVLFPPNSCRYKIYIIDEVHMLSVSAFNALLKTIEEPPPYVIFIFATTELHKVPATIKSRCQQFHFRLVAVEQIKELLAAAAAEINIQAEDEALYWIARESTGSIRDAYTLFDQVASFSGGTITYDKISNKLGLTSIDTLNALCENCIDGHADTAIDLLDKLLQNGISIEQFISDIADYLRSILLISAGIVRESLLGQAADRYSQKVLCTWKPVQIERALSLFLNLYRDIRYSLDPRYETELTVFRLCSLSGYVSASEVKAAIDAARNMLIGNTPSVKSANIVPQVSIRSAETEKQSLIQNVQAEYTQSPISRREKPEPRMPTASFSTFETMRSLVAEKEQSDRKQPLPDAPAAPAELVTAVQTNQKAAEAAGQSQPVMIADLQEAAVQELMGKGEAGPAMMLARTTEWLLDGDIVHVTTDSALSCTQLQKEAARIAQLLSEMLGRNIRFEPVLTEEKRMMEQQKKTDIPIQAQILCSLFKGSIIGGIQ